MASIKEVPPQTGRFERIGAHTHVKGLGLDEELNAIKIKDGMVGQEKAREAAGLVVRMIREGKLSGKSIIVAGPPGTGKTAIAVGVSRELGPNVPFIQMSGSEIYSSERKKTEVLVEAIRKCIGIEIHETRKVYEGEVTNVNACMHARIHKLHAFVLLLLMRRRFLVFRELFTLYACDNDWPEILTIRFQFYCFKHSIDCI